MTLRGLTAAVEQQLEMAALSGEVDAVMRSVAEGACERLDGDGAALTVQRGDALVVRVAIGSCEHLAGVTAPLEGSVSGRCLLERSTLVLDDVLAPPTGREATAVGVEGGSMIIAPLVGGDRTYGLLMVHSRATAAFGTDAAEDISLLARSAAIALRNAELVERLTSAERETRALVEQSADPLIVFDTDFVVLAANDATATLLWYSREELVGKWVGDLFPPGEVETRPVRRDELLRRRELRTERPLLRKDGAVVQVESALRLLDDGRIVATVRDITQRNRNEARLRESLGRLRAIVESQREISELELEPDAVTDAILDRLQRLTGADGAAVIALEPHRAFRRWTSGRSAQYRGLEVDRTKSLVGLAATTRKTHYAPDVETDPRVDREAARRVGLGSLICAPLLRGNDVVAVLCCESQRPHAFDELAVETTRLMAEFVGAALRNAEELEARRVLVEQLRLQGEVVLHMQTGLHVWQLGDDGVFRLRSANAASHAALGLPLAEVVGRTLDEVLPGLPEEERAAMHRLVAEGGRVDLGEVEYADPRVAPRILSRKMFALHERRVAVTFEDVTERVGADRALAESEQRFRRMFESACSGIAVSDLEGHILDVNDAFARMLGRTRDELLASSIDEITHPDDRATYATNTTAMASGLRDRHEYEKRYLRKGGGTVWARVAVALVRDYDGTPLHRLTQAIDITALKEAEQLFASVFERSLVPKLILDDQRRLVEANDATAELIGLPRAELTSLRLDDLLPTEPVERAWTRFLARGTTVGETVLHRPDGGRRAVEFTATAHARPGRHVVLVRDLTRQKELEIQLRQAQKMEAVGRLAGGIAHDFNNLLTAISGYSEFLTSSLDDERLRRHAEEIRKAAGRAAALTGQLLAFSRRQVLQPRTVDLNAVVRDMESMLRRLIGEDVEFVTQLDPELGSVQADPTQVEQVIVNLTVNARDAMLAGGSAVLATSNVDGDDGRPYVELSITDTGVGMSAQERQHLFDPFFTTKEGGTGLGLATVYGIVEQSGGVIEVDSEPGLGSSFRVLLPRVAPAEVEAPAAPAESDHGTGSETILLVEDESVVRQLVAEILESSGYTVLQATDGPSALELLRRHRGRVDLLVTDVVMPGMSGPDVARAVTAMRPGTQVLFTSGYTDSAIDHHGVLRPGIAFLQKPFTADDLTRKVRALVEAPAAGVA